MSWQEYSDMFDISQQKGKYRCHLFDMKDSKKGYDINNFYKLLNNFKLNIDGMYLHKPENLKNNPFIFLGDLIILITKRDSISDDEIYKLFKEAKKKSNFNKEFHFMSGNYETDDWVEGNKLYYRGYCIQELEYRAKQRKELL